MFNFELLLERPMRVMWSRFERTLNWTNGSNIIIKNLDKSIQSVDLFDTFSVFGKIVSCKVVESKGYGYVQYESQEAAASAIKRLNGMLLNNQYVTIEYFKYRDERKPEARPQHQDNNLFIKNLDYTINDECLRTVFAEFGTIISAKVMMENGLSKGFGFVSFTSSQEATTAQKALNGKMWGKKQVYVGVALRKEERQSQLEHEKAQKMLTGHPSEDIVPGFETAPLVDTVQGFETAPSEDSVPLQL
ncbi:polyadenylate-binding protein 4-like [Tachysurus vachellii]|uniref:polyadenylate-binding protein 4-like n=1 Tax=Tachysurus vachellii TaxID=175792 RepID=UPI00296B4AEA|nr:polyadenylate-binding protein 4-like [Tachysurus vachellii]